MIFNRRTLSALGLFLAAGSIAGCSTTSPFGDNQRAAAPAQLPPVQSGSVQSSNLPPLQGQDGAITTADTFDPTAGGDPALAGQTASVDGSFVSIDDVGGSTLTPAGRDLSGTLTPTKLLGAWTVSADLQQCRLNLTQTTKTGTSRFRASTPGCTMSGLMVVSSWQLAGSQVQLFDENGDIIAAFQQTGNRFVGTMAGGIPVSMDG
jgi:Protease inhibitor Inh